MRDCNCRKRQEPQCDVVERRTTRDKTLARLAVNLSKALKAHQARNAPRRT